MNSSNLEARTERTHVVLEASDEVTQRFFDDIVVGSTFTGNVPITATLLGAFVTLSNDLNKFHKSEGAGRSARMPGVGILTAASGVVSHYLGYGRGVPILKGFSVVQFEGTISVGDILRIDGIVIWKGDEKDKRGTMKFCIKGFNKRNNLIITGETDVIVPKRRGGS